MPHLPIRRAGRSPRSCRTALALVMAAAGVVAETNHGNAPPSAAGPAAAEVFRKTCSRCHAADEKWPGSNTAEYWRKTVARMQKKAEGSDKAFDDAAAKQIVRYLAGDVKEDTGKATPGNADAPAPPRDSGNTTSGHTEHEESAVATLAGGLGIGTAVLALLSITSGLLRRRLKRRFRPLHIALAVLIAAALAGHGGIMVLQVGAAKSAWHIAGVLAGTILLCTMIAGIARRRLKRRFLPVHKTLAAIAVILIVLHRIL